MLSTCIKHFASRFLQPQNALRKILIVIFCRNDYAETAISFNLTTDKLQTVLNVMKNEADSFSNQVQQSFELIYQSLLPKLNTLDNFVPSVDTKSNQVAAYIEKLKEPKELVNAHMNKVRLQYNPQLDNKLQAMTAENLELHESISEKKKILKERLAHLNLKKQVLTEVSCSLILTIRRLTRLML